MTDRGDGRAVHLRAVTPADRPQVADWLADFLRGLSAYGRVDMPYAHFDAYWCEPDRRWIWLLCDPDGVAGFCFVRKPEEADADFEFSEFCVLPDCRRRGIGAAVVPQILELHPGRWRLRVMRRNGPALGFWSRVLMRPPVRDLARTEDAESLWYRFSV